MRKLLLFLFTLSILAQPCLGDTDWSRLVVRQSTSDHAKAVELLRIELYELQFDAKMNVGEFLRKHRDREKMVAELLQGYKMDQHYLTDGTIEYDYYLALTSGIIAAILPETKPVGFVVPMLCPCCGQTWPAEKQPSEGITLIPKEIEKTNFSGIVIDCRGLKLNPCLFPKVFNDSLNEVFSVNFADTNYVAQYGLVTYTTNDAQSHSRIGDKPLRIKALGVFGDKRTDIKISTHDSQRIHGSQNNLNLLRECRVAIIFGP